MYLDLNVFGLNLGVIEQNNSAIKGESSRGLVRKRREKFLRRKIRVMDN